MASCSTLPQPSLARLLHLRKRAYSLPTGATETAFLSDSLSLIKLCSADLQPPWEISTLLFDIKVVASLHNFTFWWVSDTVVGDAHRIVKLVLNRRNPSSQPEVFFSLFPAL